MKKVPNVGGCVCGGGVVEEPSPGESALGTGVASAVTMSGNLALKVPSGPITHPGCDIGLDTGNGTCARIGVGCGAGGGGGVAGVGGAAGANGVSRGLLKEPLSSWCKR